MGQGEREVRGNALTKNLVSNSFIYIQTYMKDTEAKDMPNHIKNRVTIDKDVDWTQFEGEDGFTFNKIIPTPENIYQGEIGMSDMDKDDVWYNWCIQNWGTKWDAYEVEIIDENTIEFNTAWCMPRPIILKLSEILGCHVECQYADEDIGYNCGWFECENGEQTGWEEGGRKFALDLWGWEEEGEE